jgi:hypothetical protein
MKSQGGTWASQAALRFQIPSQASLHGMWKRIAIPLRGINCLGANCNSLKNVWNDMKLL